MYSTRMDGVVSPADPEKVFPVAASSGDTTLPCTQNVGTFARDRYQNRLPFTPRKPICWFSATDHTKYQVEPTTRTGRCPPTGGCGTYRTWAPEKYTPFRAAEYTGPERPGTAPPGPRRSAEGTMAALRCLQRSTTPPSVTADPSAPSRVVGSAAVKSKQSRGLGHRPDRGGGVAVGRRGGDAPRGRRSADPGVRRSTVRSRGYRGASRPPYIYMYIPGRRWVKGAAFPEIPTPSYR